MADMHAHIEPIAGVIRVFADGGRYGDPYTFAATLRWVNREVVELMGATRAPRPSEWRAMDRALAALGVRRAVWTRRDGERSREVEIILRGAKGKAGP